MKSKAALLCALGPVALAASPANADVWVYGNGATLDVLIFGNAEDSPDRMADRAFSITRENWYPLWQGDSSERGWIAVSCVRRPDGGTHFEYATAQPSKAVAEDLAMRAAQQHVERYGGNLIVGCGGSANNDGRVLAEVIPPKR